MPAGVCRFQAPSTKGAPHAFRTIRHSQASASLASQTEGPNAKNSPHTAASAMPSPKTLIRERANIASTSRKQAESLKSCPVLDIVGGDEISKRPKSRKSSSLSGRERSRRKAGHATAERHHPPVFLPNPEVTMAILPRHGRKPVPRCAARPVYDELLPKYGKQLRLICPAVQRVLSPSWRFYLPSMPKSIRDPIAQMAWRIFAATDAIGKMTLDEETGGCPIGS